MSKRSEAGLAELGRIALELRRTTLKMIHRARSGHPGGALSVADILTVLYFHQMNIRPEEPLWPDRDRFVLSKGHSCPIWYAALAKLGYFDESHLWTLRQFGSILQGHPAMIKTPGVDSTSGSLGQGLSIGVGMALVSKLDKAAWRVFVVLGCGEMNEGQVWEAAQAANKYHLDNLIAIVDYNKLQLDGTNDEVMPTEPLDEKWRSFGWNVRRIDGHDMGQIVEALAAADEQGESPTIIIADTVKGKGVSFMEHSLNWHGKPPSDEQLEAALAELTEQ